jgi:hypothetical protein
LTVLFCGALRHFRLCRKQPIANTPTVVITNAGAGAIRWRHSQVDGVENMGSMLAVPEAGYGR